MASNMSLKEKETEREKGEGKENTVITNIHAIMAHTQEFVLWKR